MTRAANGPDFFDRDAIGLFGVEGVLGSSLIECPETQVHRQGVLDDLGVRLRGGVLVLLASAMDQLLVERNVHLSHGHAQRVPARRACLDAVSGHVQGEDFLYTFKGGGFAAAGTAAGGACGAVLADPAPYGRAPGVREPSAWMPLLAAPKQAAVGPDRLELSPRRCRPLLRWPIGTEEDERARWARTPAERPRVVSTSTPAG
jgi:hypothetical protein